MFPRKRILFVDDEPRLLRGLRRQLNGLSRVLDLVFVYSGVEAVKVLGEAENPFDLVVTDIRMPGMDGVQLLKHIHTHHPSMIRIVLSGQVDQEAALGTAGLAHQFLSKPCQAETLQTALFQCIELGDRLNAPRLQCLISQLTTLPGLPTQFSDLVEELKSPKPSIQAIGRIVSQDIGMTAKILQLVNSAFFGLGRHISDPVQAVMVIGLEMIKVLVLSIQIFPQQMHAAVDVASLKSLQQHSLTVATLARQIAKAAKATPDLVDLTFTAGLLHDIGYLVLLLNFPEEYERVKALVVEQNISLPEAEQLVFGATHSEVGAYLLGIWGLPYEIIAASAFHHRPEISCQESFSPSAAVFVADAIVHELKVETPVNKWTETSEGCPGYPNNFLQWRELGQALFEKGL